MKAGCECTSFCDTVLRLSRCCRSPNGAMAIEPAIFARHKQLAVERALESQMLKDVGEGAGDIVAGARIEFSHALFRHRLHADAVPFPFGGVVLRGELCGKLRLVERLRQHDRAEGRERGGDGALGASLKPGEELRIGRLEPVPELLDLRHVLAAHLGERLLGEARGDADAQAAGDELQERVAAGRVEPVEPALDEARAFQPRGGVERLHDL